MSTKSSLGTRNNAPFSQYDVNSRSIASRTSSVTVFYYHWNKQNFGTSTNVQTSVQKSTSEKLSKSYTLGKIEGEVESCTISKNIEQASATFNFNLFPSVNWRQKISPGDWVLIYFHSSHEPMGTEPNSTKNLVLIGNVDRISRVIQKDENTDTTTLRYQVSGRNFGKVFEQTDIWYDPYTIQTNTLDVALRTAGLEIVGSPDSQVNKILDIFLGKGGQLPTGKTSSLNQWFIPDALAALIGSSSGKSFDSVLKREIKKNLPGYKPRNMITPNSNGSLWDMLKRSCNELVNEIYVEEVRDSKGNVKPTIILKPRPFQTPFFDNRGADNSQFGKDDAVIRSALKGAYKSLQDFSKESFVEILQSEVIYENLGRDDHARINMLWFNTTLNYEYILSPTSSLSQQDGVITNPIFSRPSIQRHGLRRMDSLLEFCHTEAKGSGPQNNITLFRAFAAQLYDMNYANHLYEQGTIECTGVLEAELGKVLVIRGTSGQPRKIYFIEGYEHKWSYPNTWTTVFTVSKGQFYNDDNRLNIFIDVDEADFGAPDTSLDLSYVAKTNIRGKD